MIVYTQLLAGSVAHRLWVDSIHTVIAWIDRMQTFGLTVYTQLLPGSVAQTLLA